MGIPLHSKARRMIRSGINFLLINFSRKKLDQQELDPEKIKRILIVRINYRIGNIIFLTPLINALVKKMPAAKIDILIGANYIAPVLLPMKNVNKVYDAPRKLLRNPFKLFLKVKELNANHYDLVISPVIASGSANISTLLIKADHKLGFYSQHTWSAANITVAYPDKVKHEALRPLALMEAFAGHNNGYYSSLLDINLSADEQIKGQKLLQELLSVNAVKSPSGGIIGLFREARNEKKIADAWWQDFIEQTLANYPDILIVEILAPSTPEKLNQNTLSVSFKNLRELACFMSALDTFICADTGPMHLASAAKVPVIAFFNATSPNSYGPLGELDRVVTVIDKSVNEIVNETQQKYQEILFKSDKQQKVTL